MGVTLTAPPLQSVLMAPEAAAPELPKAGPSLSAAFSTAAQASKTVPAASRADTTGKRGATKPAEDASRLRHAKRAKTASVQEPTLPDSDDDDAGVENQQVMLMRMINTMMQVMCLASLKSPAHNLLQASHNRKAGALLSNGCHIKVLRSPN